MSGFRSAKYLISKLVAQALFFTLLWSVRQPSSVKETVNRGYRALITVFLSLELQIIEVRSIDSGSVVCVVFV